MKAKVNKGGAITNEKNMSSLRCQENTYQKPYSKVIKSRHRKLTVDVD